MHEFVSVNGLGGGMELGFVQAGMKLVHRAGSLALGAPVVEGNRPVIGWEWTSSFSKEYREWPRFSVPIVMGNPPCSAWSTLTRKDLRGGDAAIMSCTQELIDYSSVVPFAPYLIAIESVQQAYSTGRAWYQNAREELSRRTGFEYDLVWVMQSNATLGGASVRKRVFVCFTRIPFGVEYAQPARVARLGDAIRDLEGLHLTMEKQPYQRPATWWSMNRRAEEGVDGHFVSDKANAPYRELWNLLEAKGIPWQPGQSTTEVLRKLHAVNNGKLPEPWGSEKRLDKLVERDFDLGLNQTGCWDPEKQSQVVTGRGPDHSVHWAEPRLYTQRECARIQGFPDTWRIWPARNYNALSSVWGKGVPVDAGRWLGSWFKAALDGTPGFMRGEPIGPNERMIQLTRTFERTLDMERRWEHQRYVPHEEGHWVDREHEAVGSVCC